MISHLKSSDGERQKSWLRVMEIVRKGAEAIEYITIAIWQQSVRAKQQEND